MDRKTDLTVLTENLRQCIRPHNVHVHIDLIAGLPYEDYKTFAASFNSALRWGRTCCSWAFEAAVRFGSLDARQKRGRILATSSQSWRPMRCSRRDGFRRMTWQSCTKWRMHWSACITAGGFADVRLSFASHGWSPFALFEAFGRYAAAQGTAGVSLDL